MHAQPAQTRPLPRAQQDRAGFRAQQIRSETGLGASKAAAH